MDKKWSLGIILFAIYFLFNSIGIIHSPNLISAGYLLLGISILTFKEWARKGVIYFNIFLISISIYGLFIEVFYPNPSLRIHIRQTPNHIRQIRDLIFLIVLFLLTIYFFTRPKVKEQFK